MGLSSSLMPAASGAWATSALQYVSRNISTSVSEESERSTFLQNSSKNTAITRVVATLAVAFFAAVDIAYHATACALKAPCILGKSVIDRLCRYDCHLPETISSAECEKHVGRIVKSAIVGVVAIVAGPINPEIVVNMASKIGYLAPSSEASNEIVSVQNSATI
jgi:hypothetical protein